MNIVDFTTKIPYYQKMPYTSDALVGRQSKIV